MIDKRRRGSDRTCPNCGRSVWVTRAAQSRWRACSRLCLAALRRRLVAWNGLQQRILERMMADGLTFTDVANRSGVNRTTIRRWFGERGRYLRSESVKKLSTYLGLADDEALALAGGRRGEGEMARTGRANIEAGRPVPGSAKFRRARRKAGLKMRGRPHRPDWKARIGASNRKSGTGRLGAERLVAFQSTPIGGLAQRLWIRLRWHPAPDRATIRRWAAEIADRTGTTESEVLAAWKPYLQRRGLWSTRGRKANERRHAIVGHLNRIWPTRKHGFWDVVAAIVEDVDGDQRSGIELAQWWAHHRRYCLTAEPDLASDKAITGTLRSRGPLTDVEYRRVRERGPAELVRMLTPPSK